MEKMLWMSIDRCIFQWKHVMDDVDDVADDYNRDLDSEDEDDQKDGDKICGISLQ